MRTITMSDEAYDAFKLYLTAVDEALVIGRCYKEAVTRLAAAIEEAGLDNPNVNEAFDAFDQARRSE